VGFVSREDLHCSRARLVRGSSRRLESVRLTREAAMALFVANQLARWQGAPLADLQHLIFGAAQQPIGFALLERAGIDPHQLAKSLKGSEARETGPSGIRATTRAGDALRRAKELALEWSHPKATSGHLVIASAAAPTGWGKTFGSSIGVDPKSLRRVAESFPFVGEDLETSDVFIQLLELDWIQGDAREWLERRYIGYSIENSEDLRSSVALLVSSADGQGLSHYPDWGVRLGGLTGDTSLTLQCYQKAQSVRPEHADYFRLSGALALANRGEFEEAREIIRVLLERASAPGIYVSAAQVEYLADRVDEARTYLIKASSTLGGESVAARQVAEILWHSIDGGFEHSLRAIVGSEPKKPHARLTRGLARIALAKDASSEGNPAASNELYQVINEYGIFGMEGVVLQALVVLAESQRVNGDERFSETKSRAIGLATRLGRPVRVRHLMSP